MVFFVSADQRVYGRYGGRDPRDSDSRHSLPGLHYAMRSALESHSAGKVAIHADASPATDTKPFRIRDRIDGNVIRGCIHCHQINEIRNRDALQRGQQPQEIAWRYPLPDNLGIRLDNDRGNVIERITPASIAAVAGLQVGDVIDAIDGRSVRSFGDAIFALDRAAATEPLRVHLQRDGQPVDAALQPEPGWRRTDLTWRRSMQHLLAHPRLNGEDLTADEKRSLNLSPDELAFRQRDPVLAQAAAAGVLPGDIVLGFDDQQLKMDAYDFQHHVPQHYVTGETVVVNIIRNGRRLNLPMKFAR